MGQRWRDGYSAQVELYLLVAGERYEVAQVANGALMLRDARTIPPETAATLVVNIDDKNEAKEIFLRDGAKGNTEFARYF